MNFVGNRAWRVAAVAALTWLAVAADALAQAPPQDPKSSAEVYGFVMLDFGHNFNQIHPNWFDTLRVTKLPKVEKEYGEDGSSFWGVRQTRLGVRTSTPTDYGDLTTQFEFELFGVGVDEGQTTFRLRHAYGELGAIGAGQYLEPVHGHRRLSQLGRVPGARRAWCSSGTSRCDGCRSRATRG